MLIPWSTLCTLLADDIDEIVAGMDVLPATADDIRVDPEIVDVVELVAEDMVVIKASDDFFRPTFGHISPPAEISKSKLLVKCFMGMGLSSRSSPAPLEYGTP